MFTGRWYCKIFENDDTIYTVSTFQKTIHQKQSSNIDIELEDGMEDENILTL